MHDRDADGDGVFDEPDGIATTLVSLNSTGNSLSPSISADGRFVAFFSDAPLDPSEPAGGVFVHDRQSGGTTRVAEGSSPSISADGRFVAFTSDATNLVDVDTNNVSEIFVRGPLALNVGVQVGSVTLTFDNVTQAGTVNLTTSDTGPPPDSGFQLCDPPTYYDLGTTALFSGSVQVCIDYSGTSCTDESNLKLFHFEGGTWVDVTDPGYPDTINDVICAPSPLSHPLPFLSQPTAMGMESLAEKTCVLTPLLERLSMPRGAALTSSARATDRPQARAGKTTGSMCPV